MAFSNPSLWFSPPSSNIYYPLLHFYCCMTICIYRNSFIHQYCSEMVSFFSDSSWWIDIGFTHRRDSWNSNQCQINHFLFNQCREWRWICFCFDFNWDHFISHLISSNQSHHWSRIILLYHSHSHQSLYSLHYLRITSYSTNAENGGGFISISIFIDIITFIIQGGKPTSSLITTI